MNRKLLITIVVISLILTGCSSIENNISEEEAGELIREERSGDIGDVEIISIEKKNNSYIIEWKNEENKEMGIDKITKDRKIERIKTEIE